MFLLFNSASQVPAAHAVRAVDTENPFKFYHYHPTEAGAIIFMVLFLSTTLWHSWQLLRHRVWIVTPIIIGGLFEIIGYGARYASGKETPDWTLTPYIIQAILLLVAPALYAATIYMELRRIITLIDGEELALILRKWMTKIFVVGDVLSFFLQGGGGGYQSSGTFQALETGANIIIIGLFVQLAFFGAFLIVAVSFHIKIKSYPTARSCVGIPWQEHLNMLYVDGILIMVRSIFRAVEYLQGFNGYLLSHETYLYVFDALLMLIVMVLFSITHPAELFVARNRIDKFALAIDLKKSLMIEAVLQFIFVKHRIHILSREVTYELLIRELPQHTWGR